MDPEMRRLYVGGLSHTVSQKDLKDRFGKFGDVQDVELRTRRDEDGVPYKTFGYININISDVELKKCLTVLNKSRWKGGTLHIETAKESFLHRLAQERQEAAEQHLHQSSAEDKRRKLLDSLSKAGVENFTMKAAVPGSEVPGHKDWVVSKFGRVLPVLQLRCQKGSKARTVKYDPSKYSHNIRKLDRNSSDESVPVTRLTWEVQGGDDDISKKRRGEFPAYQPSRPKKSRTDGVNIDQVLDRTRTEQIVTADVFTEAHQLTNGSKPTNYRPAHRNRKPFTDSDVDSEEEIHRLVAAQQVSHNALQRDFEEDQLEVVGTDYLVKSGRKGDGHEDGYDSADTDELFTSRKNPPARAQEKLPASTVKKMKTKKKTATSEEEEEGKADITSVLTREDSAEEKRRAVLPVMKHSSSESDSDEEDVKSSDSSSDSDYEAMFSNVTHLEISLDDLKRLAETAVPSMLSWDPERDAKQSSSPAEHPALKTGTTPEEILASILAEDISEDEEKMKKKERKGVTSTPLPAFQGTKSLYETSERDEGQRRRREDEEGGCDAKKLNFESQENQKSADDKKQNNSETKTSERREEEEEPSSSSSSEEDEMEVTPAEAAPCPAPYSESSTSEDEEEEEQVVARAVLGAHEEEELQRKANMRRLAALHQRQKEAEEHKRLIQGALSNLDAPAAVPGKHIVFGSDDEEKQDVVSELVASKITLIQDSQSEEEISGEGGATAKDVRLKPSGAQLFADSEDEEGGDDEDDRSRFDIRPEFEGRAGQKLMALQSRFGTDERFKMDSRFLEDEEEDEEEEELTEVKKNLTEDDEVLEEERKKNLSILQNVLGSSQQTSSSKTASKAKMFRDVAALHYDPSKEEHAAFEIKTNETKESKSARRKKREEALKVPEVPKEIYYDVSGDLKAVFGQAKEDIAEGEKASWDQAEEEEGGGEEEQWLSSLISDDTSNKNEESSGFKFSFFGDNLETGSGETIEYKSETIQAPKVSWQQDPRFHDSSSEEEEEEEEEGKEQSSITVKTAEEEPPSNPDFFFFHPEDNRLNEGPRLFCRTSQLEEQREQWVERRSALRQEYRKKHKDARRSLKTSTSQKS